MQFIDDAEFQINIDLDQGARISSLIWRDMQFAVPFRGSPMTYGWYAMAPWAGRVRDGIIKSPSGEEFQLPTTAFRAKSKMRFVRLDLNQYLSETLHHQ